jgi:hypothetical protein
MSPPAEPHAGGRLTIIILKLYVRYINDEVDKAIAFNIIIIIIIIMQRQP